jgi:23S rRNA (adenine2503-C2)-methyltransferase
MKCKMCYLTQNGNTSFDHVDIPNYTKQITTVLDFYQKNRIQTATRCNINFMARGEPLANKFVINHYPQLYDAMTETCAKYNLTMKPNISSIFPDTIRDHKLIDVFKDKPAYLYYSMYSLNEDFRRKWLPRALPYEMVLSKLKDYQLQSGHLLTFHWSLIKGENDSLDEAKRMADLFNKWDFNAKFQIVRFNKHPKLNYEEADLDRINEVFQIINAGLGNHEKSYIVPRVGRDVYASCGTFVDDKDIQAGLLNL